MREASFLPEDPSVLASWRATQYIDDSQWFVNDSGIGYYSRCAYLNGRADGLTDLLSERLANTQNGIGMEIAAGSNAVALRELLESGLLAGALALNLCDTRSDETRQDDRISHLAGDVTLRETWGGIYEWIEDKTPEGLDLILFHPVGGLSGLPQDVYEDAAHHMVDLLKPGGVFFAQAPKPLLAGNPRLRKLYKGLCSRDDVESIAISDFSFFEEDLPEDLLSDAKRLRTMYAAIIKS